MVNFPNILPVRALIYSLGLQIVALLLCTLHVGGVSGFGEILRLIVMLVLTPKVLIAIMTGDFRLSANALEALSWGGQVGTWFAIFYAVLYWRSQWDKKTE